MLQDLWFLQWCYQDSCLLGRSAAIAWR